MSFRNPPSSSLRLRPQAEDSNATEKTSLKSEPSEDPHTHPNTISQKPNTNIHSEDRALSYRNSNDPALLDSLTFIQGRRQRLSLTLIFPTILVVIGTAGIATLFLLWLLLHKTQANDVWRDRAFIVDEGTKLEGGRAAARLLGLTISSAASEIVSITTPILIGLYAFRVARDWLSLSRKDALEDDRDLPTPLQYGLLVGLLGGAGLGALMQAGSYLTRGGKRRVQASSMLIQSFLVTLTIYILTHAISGVDLWLHALTTTVLLPTNTPVETPFKFSIGQDTCPPYPDPWYEAIHPCLMMEGGWGQGVSSLTPGMLVASNSSENLQIITLAEADDLAVLVKPNVQQSVAFRATTFGARASCQSVNALCVHGEELAPQNCTGFPPSFPPVSNVTNSGGLQEGDSKVFIQSSNCPPDVACEHISTDLITTLAAALNPTVPPVNAYSLWMQFLWEAGGDQVFGRSPEGNDAVDNYSNLATMLTNCTLRFYNVTLDYRNGSYVRVDEELSNVGLSDGLAAPTRLGHYASHLISNIQGHAFTDNSTDRVIAYLQQDLARLALGSAAVITNLTTDTLSQSNLGTSIVGRYLFWPVVILLILLYLHTAVALLIFLLTVIFTHTDFVALSDTGDGVSNGKPVSTLELTRARLMKPVALAAMLFPPSNPDVSRTALSIETDPLNMFHEQSDHERLRPGLHSAESNGGTVFGIWRREPMTPSDSRSVETP